MEENRQHIDKLFREELGSYTELPAPDVWASLDKRLDEHYKDAAKGSSYRWLWYVLLALLAALLFYGVWSFTNGKMASEKPTLVESASCISNSGTTVRGNSSVNKNAEEEDDDDTAEKADHIANDADNNNNTVVASSAKENKQQTEAIKAADKNVGDLKAAKIATNKKISAANADAEGSGERNASTVHSKTAAHKHKTLAAGKTSAAMNSDEKATTGAAVTKDKAPSSKSIKPKKETIAEIAKTNKTESANEDAVASQNDKSVTASKPQKQTSSKTQHHTKPKRNKKSAATSEAAKDETTAANEAKRAKQGNPIKEVLASSNNKPAKSTTTNKPPDEGIQDKTDIATADKKLNDKPSVKQKDQQQSATTDNIKTTRPNKGKGSLNAEHKYAGSTENNKENVGQNKQGNKQRKPASATAANKTGTPKKKSNAAKQGINNNDEEPHQTFADNNAKPKKPAGPKVNKPDDKPKVEWQKGFTADDSRGLKDVKAGSSNSDAGSDDAAPKAATTAAGKGGGGGGATSTGEEDNKKKKNKEHKKFDFSAGIKAGYEKGFSSYQANKVVIAPYFQYNFAEGVSLVLQPSIKYAMLNKTQMSDPKSYYNVTGSGIDSNNTRIPIDSFAIHDTILRRYYYSQTHDSIVASTRIGQKRYYEFELPVMLQYKLSKSISAYIGVTMNYSKIVQIVNDQQNYTGLTRRDSTIFAPTSAAAPAPTPVYPAYFSQFSGTPYSQYTAGQLANATTNQLRFSYTIGITYLFGQRFMFDLMFVKMFSNPAYIPDPNVKDIYKQGYLRFSLGYKFK